VRRGRATALAALIAAAVALPPGSAVAQSPGAQPQLYLLTTDAFDARALWVQPAGLAARREASVSGLLTASTGSTWTITQYGVTLASGGLGLGWQHDHRADGSSDNQWAVGLAGGGPRFTLGAARRWIRGANANASAWDVGARFVPRPAVLLSLAWRDIGSPDVRDTVVPATLVPAVALGLFGARAAIGADWEILARSWNTRAFRTGAAVALPLRITVSLRADFSGSLHARGAAVAVTWGGLLARVAAFASRPGVPGIDQAGAWVAAVRPLDGSRRRR
jgi:hypothetical protein